METRHKILITFIIFIFIIPSIGIFMTYINWRGQYNKIIVPAIKSSKIVEEQLGKVKKVSNKLVFKINIVSENEALIEYIVKTSSGKYSIDAIISMRNKEMVVIGYMIDGKRYDETN
ncbi:MAG: hypothetical protein HFI86_06730 [Bacilli bacterium]|nr:hypothetical protein [Bacilli bacterium]